MGYDIGDFLNDIGDFFDAADWERRYKALLGKYPEVGKFVKFVLRLLEFYKPEWVKLINELVARAESMAEELGLLDGAAKLRYVIEQLPDHWLSEDRAAVNAIIELAVQILPGKLEKRGEAQ